MSFFCNRAVLVYDLDHIPWPGFGESQVGADMPFDGALIFLLLQGSKYLLTRFGEGLYRGFKDLLRSYDWSPGYGLCL